MANASKVSDDMDERIDCARRRLRVYEGHVAKSRQELASLEAEREALAQAYPTTLETAPDDEKDHVVVGVAMDSPMASVEVEDFSGDARLAYVTPADARRMAVWLAAFAEEHGA